MQPGWGLLACVGLWLKSSGALAEVKWRIDWTLPSRGNLVEVKRWQLGLGFGGSSGDPPQAKLLRLMSSWALVWVKWGVLVVGLWLESSGALACAKRGFG